MQKQRTRAEQVLDRLDWTVIRRLDGLLQGDYRTFFQGFGLDFADIREYQYGDDVRTLDWNVTARVGTPYVKRFVEERERTLILLVDASRSMRFGTQDRTKHDLLVELAALLALCAVHNQDRVGLLLFTDRVERFFRPSRGLPHALKLLRHLLFFEPGRRGTNLSAALDFLNKIQKRRAIVFVMSDFLDVSFDKPLARAARRHDLTLIRLSDPREVEPWPEGVWWLEDAETGEQRLIDMTAPEVRAAWLQHVDAQRGTLGHPVLASPLHLVDVSTLGGHVESLIHYFQRRQPQRRRPR
jgi:uncharacterized protein (DUF58 family)